MLRRLSKLAGVSATLRALHEKRAGLLDISLKAGKAVGKFALNHPAGTALGATAGVKGVSSFNTSLKGFKANATPTF